MREPAVYNISAGSLPAGTIYVGRPSRWGNPYRATSEEERDEVCDKFEEYAMAKLLDEPHWLNALKGKGLVCYCAPKRCHADTLLRLANQPIRSINGYFDGICEPAYRGGPRNPGGVAAGGWGIKQDSYWWPFMRGDLSGNRVYKVGTGATNNVAEYEAALDCLREIYRAKWRGRVTLFGDSALVINQVNGQWACNAPHLRELLEHVHRAMDFFESVEFLWIPREQNQEADAQSRLAYTRHLATLPKRLL